MFDLEDAKKRGCLSSKGAKVRIICDDRKDIFPVVGLYSVDDCEGVLCCRVDGTGNADWHLVNLPREVTVWVAAGEGCRMTFSTTESGAWADCDVWRRNNLAAGYAPVTIKLTR